VHSSWGDSQASINTHLVTLEQREDFIKSCRTSHSELLAADEEVGTVGSPIQIQSQREESNQLQHYNLRLLGIIDTLKIEVTRLTAEILEKDGRLKYHV